MLAPLQRNGDLTPARLENGVVRTSPGFTEGYKAIAEGGWVGMSADPEYGGMGLPMTLTAAVSEMMSGACLSLQLAPLMTQGQIEALEHHASDAIKELYLPKLISGEWTGTMNLTEPQAGSDVGALTHQGGTTTAMAPMRSPGRRSTSPGAITISAAMSAIWCWRACPMRLRGPRGSACSWCRSSCPTPTAIRARATALSVVSLEHKMGLHGSPTCVMQYRRCDRLAGRAKQGGMAAMFTMMNNARLGVGGQGIGVAEAAYQQALAYAQDRKQGKHMRAVQQDTILDHADVRRMLTHDEGGDLRRARNRREQRGRHRHGPRDGRQGVEGARARC